ncbi:MAG TPA: DUF2497 domain-containing protein [Acidisoma sp.]|uniref:DUF2497 domain-containing protein n=1 Tax=Acidisoma sp. TaxID=1872115 RepID=UPI002B770F09|nr:DUF2497 domain-containing protein [Acidisoma sp.]HTI02355.1 DUF2497 domain-containing protein [Acidisoma sp.]
MNTKPEDQDPSMDDILASIRRIMLDEQARLKESGPAGQEAPQQHEHDEPPPPVLVLDDSMAVREPPPETVPAAVPAEPAEGEPVAEAAAEPLIMTALEPVVAEPAAPGPAVETPAAEPAITGPFSQLDAQALEALLAPAAAAAATASVDAMLRQLQVERESFLQGGTTGGPSLEQVVRGEIRPMLKSWLDEHLPEIVERLVRAELARLTLRHGA